VRRYNWHSARPRKHQPPSVWRRTGHASQISVVYPPTGSRPKKGKWAPRLHFVRSIILRWGELIYSAPPDPLAGGEGAGSPSPRTPTPALAADLKWEAWPLSDNKAVTDSRPEMDLGPICWTRPDPTDWVISSFAETKVLNIRRRPPKFQTLVSDFGLRRKLETLVSAKYKVVHCLNDPTQPNRQMSIDGTDRRTDGHPTVTYILHRILCRQCQ